MRVIKEFRNEKIEDKYPVTPTDGRGAEPIPKAEHGVPTWRLSTTRLLHARPTNPGRPANERVKLLS